ncbi:MAG: cysteine hydrolase [Candidatus Lokiarchaeota archaeon]|nr:cysteine hydrolase [Candidatus Harpocratesius repetitus]
MKKEKYYTLQDGNMKVSEWKSIIFNIKPYRPFSFTLKNTALLVLDMQNIFLQEKSHAFIPSGLEIISNIQKLISLFDRLNLPIIATQHYNVPENNNEKNLMNKWWKHPIEKKSKDFQLNSALIFPSITIFLKKKHYSAFYQTKLSSILRAQEITSVVITGLMTHLCCETTARDAFMHGFQTFFVIDATATYSEDLHIGSLRALAHGFSVCLSYLEILDFSNSITKQPND